jgi:hypothetical protein
VCPALAFFVCCELFGCITAFRAGEIGRNFSQRRREQRENAERTERLAYRFGAAFASIPGGAGGFLGVAAVGRTVSVLGKSVEVSRRDAENAERT